jgi:SAM-dependent methyltransferase
VTARDNEAYAAFAYAYDQALGIRFFRAMRRLLDAQLGKYPARRKTHLDVACGTGLALQHFTRLGWTSVGVDASYAMLSMARRRASQLVAGDFRALPLRGTFSRITCLYDSLNHVRERNELVAVFRAVRGVMARDSLFFFDINHPEIYPIIWGMAEPYISRGPDYRLEIATTFREGDALARARVTGWAIVPPGDVRETIDEVHQQRAWSEREITAALADAALAPVDVIGFDPFGEAEAMEVPAVKLFYVCRALARRR